MAELKIKLKAVSDPKRPETTVKSMPSTMTLRNIVPQRRTTGNVIKTVKSTNETSISAEVKNFERIPQRIDCQNIAMKVLEAVDEMSPGKTYFCGKGMNKLFCGPVMQTIPSNGWVDIGSGNCVLSLSPPKYKKISNFVENRQLGFKVGSSVGKDFALVIGANGCVLLESGAYATLEMPVFVVLNNGEYYYANEGKRVLELGSGAHLVLYTTESPILFVRKDRSEPMVATKMTQKEVEKKTNEDSKKE